MKLDADRVRLEDEVKRLRADAEGLKQQVCEEIRLLITTTDRLSS